MTRQQENQPQAQWDEDYDLDYEDYDEYDDFQAGGGGGGGGRGLGRQKTTKRQQLRGGGGGSGTIYSAKHVRAKEAQRTSGRKKSKRQP